MARTESEPRDSTSRADAVLATTIRLLDEHGYDGWQLADVARGAHVSLRTVYEHFPSRDALIVGAVEQWTTECVYGSLPSRNRDQRLADALVQLFRALMKPWIEHPTMLGVLVRAVYLPLGDRLWLQGLDAVAALHYFEGYDEALVADVGTSLMYLTYGLLSAYALDRIDGRDMLTVYERTVRRLTESAEPCA